MYIVLQHERIAGLAAPRELLEEVAEVTTDRGANSGLLMHPHAPVVVTAWCGSDTAIDVWSLDTMRRVSTTQLDVELSDLASYSDHASFPAGTDVRDGGWPAHVLPVVDTSWSSDGTTLAVTAGRSLRTYTLGVDETFTRRASYRGHAEATVAVALAARGHLVAGAVASGSIRVWDTETERELHEVSIRQRPCVLHFSWRDKLLMCGDAIGRVIAWDVSTGSRHMQFQAHRGPVSRIAFDAASGRLLTAGNDGFARLWSLERGEVVGAPMEHSTRVHDIAFADRGTAVVTVSDDGVVGCWSAADGKLLDWYRSDSPLYRVSTRSDDERVIVAGSDRLVCLRAPWGKLAKAASQPMPAPAPTFASTPRPVVGQGGVGGGEAAIGSFMAAHATGMMPAIDPASMFGSNRDLSRDTPGSGSHPRNDALTPPLGIQPGASGFGQRSIDALDRPGSSPFTAEITPEFMVDTPEPSRAPPVERARELPFEPRGGPRAAPPSTGPRPRMTPAAPERSRQVTGAVVAVEVGLTGAAADFFGSSEAFVDAALNGEAATEPPQTDAALRAGDASGEQTSGSNAGSNASNVARVAAPSEAPSSASPGQEESKPPSAVRRALASPYTPWVGVSAAALAGAALVWMLVFTYYTKSIYPSTIATQADAAVAAYVAQERASEDAMTHFVEQRRDHIRSLERRGTMLPEQIDRVRQAQQRQIVEFERDSVAALEAHAAERDRMLESLETERHAFARDRATKMGSASGAVVFMFGVLVLTTRRRRTVPIKRPPSRPPPVIPTARSGFTAS